MAVTFGVDFNATTYGFAQDIEKTRTAEVATYQDANGDTAGYQSYNEMETISMTYIDNGIALPTQGATFVIDGATYVAEEVKETWNNTEFQTCQITGRRWIPNGIPA